MYEKLVEEIIAGRRLTREDDVTFLVEGDLDSLKKGANRIREKLCGNRVDLCSIINGRAGRCSENCKFCAQSAHHSTGADEYDFLDIDKIVAECHHNEKNGCHRFSIVTAGRTLAGEDFRQAVKAYSRMHQECPEIHLCASHGLLTREQFVELKEAGVTTYHANIETSEEYFPKICTTHTFADKIQCINNAKAAGMHVCSGGIIGLGETFADRISMAFTLAEQGIYSIPINALLPIKGTPLEDNPKLSEEEILRTVTLFRFINPESYIRLAAGRTLMADSGKEAFFAGANATITGDMLTTSGNNTAEDKEMLTQAGFDISQLSEA